MKYKHKLTGFILDTSCECKGEGWELLSPPPKKAEKVETEEKPKRAKK